VYSTGEQKARLAAVWRVSGGRQAVVSGKGCVKFVKLPEVGNPCRQIAWMCERGERLTDDVDCLCWGKIDRETESGLVQVSH
jgi:hypothetical protein